MSRFICTCAETCNYEKQWLANVWLMFMAFSVVPVKALFDRIWLKQQELISALAFTLVCPLITLFNTICMSLSHAVFSSLHQVEWVANQKKESNIFAWMFQISVAVGCLVALVTFALNSLITMLLGKPEFSIYLNDFITSSAYGYSYT